MPGTRGQTMPVMISAALEKTEVVPTSVQWLSGREFSEGAYYIERPAGSWVSGRQ